MAATVDIIIKGVAICYRKGTEWHVLFPVDAEGCHKINFSYKKIDDLEESSPVSLVTQATDPIKIIVSEGGAISETGQTQNFETYVLNLTSPATHPKIRRKRVSPPGRAVLMTIPKANFGVRRYFNEFGQIPPLVEVGGSGNSTTITKLAHSVKGTIILNNTGQVTVESSALNQGKFTTERDTSYILTFDNDCNQIRPGKNDMDMFYEVIEEYDNVTGNPVNRRFRIGGVGPGVVPPDSKTIEKLIALGFDKETIEKLIALGFDKETFKQLIKSGLDLETIKQLIRIIILTEPPDPERGKPCLAVQVTEPNDLP